MSDTAVHARVGGKLYCSRSDGDFPAYMREHFPDNDEAWKARMIRDRPDLRWGADLPKLDETAAPMSPPPSRKRKAETPKSGGGGGHGGARPGAGHPKAKKGLEFNDYQPGAKKPKPPTKAEVKAEAAAAAQAAEDAAPKIRWPKLTSLTTYPLVSFRPPLESEFELPFDVRAEVGPLTPPDPS
jgi:hypothetical protein